MTDGVTDGVTLVTEKNGYNGYMVTKPQKSPIISHFFCNRFQKNGYKSQKRLQHIFIL